MGKAIDISKIRQPIQQFGPTVKELRDATKGMSPQDARQLSNYEELRTALTPLFQDLGPIAQALNIPFGQTGATSTAR